MKLQVKPENGRQSMKFTEWCNVWHLETNRLREKPCIIHIQFIYYISVSYKSVVEEHNLLYLPPSQVNWSDWSWTLSWHPQVLPFGVGKQKVLHKPFRFEQLELTVTKCKCQYKNTCFIDCLKRALSWQFYRFCQHYNRQSSIAYFMYILMKLKKVKLFEHIRKTKKNKKNHKLRIKDVNVRLLIIKTKEF